MRVGLDCRYIREPPSGIGAYVAALVARLPGLAPAASFRLWVNRTMARPLTAAENVREVVIGTGPNSPLTVYWPAAYASFDGLDLFHYPHNILPRAVSCRTIVTVHDVLALDNPALHRPGRDRVMGFYYPHAVLRALQKATHLIVPTRATADRVLSWQPDAHARMTIVPLAPDPCFGPSSSSETAAREAEAITGVAAPYVLVVGQNSVHKRHETALIAFARSAPPPWRLVLLQRTGNPASMRRLAARMGVADRVVWLSRLSLEDVARLMRGAGVLIQPSLYEGFGLPAVEAMASGCALLASDIPPIREVSDGAAMLVPPADVDGFARALRDLVGSPELRADLGQRGVERAKHFSWDRTARETLDIYEAVAAH